MRLLQSAAAALAATVPIAAAATSWGFEDATLTVQAKGAGVGGGVKEKISTSSALTSAISLSSADTLKIVLTATEGKTAKRPHQAFLTLHEKDTALEESFLFTVKENGKGKVELTQKDLPYQLLASKQPIKASIVIGSFGSTSPSNMHVFDIIVNADSASPPAQPPALERHAAKPEIHHIFRDDPRSPPKIISLVFTLSILAALPTLLGAWLLLGGNVDHLGKAFAADPLAHGLFFGSIVAMEGVFFLYYVSWNLFQTLPVAAIVGVVAYISGSRALTEVQDRRLAGER